MLHNLTMVLETAVRNTLQKLIERHRFFASTERFSQSIDPLYLTLVFKNFIVGFGNAKFVSKFRKL